MRYEQETVGLIHAAHQKAKALGHSYVGSIHLLMALASYGGAAGQILRGSGLDADLTQNLAALF